MSEQFDHILVVGFGGPEGPEDIMPFLRNVTKGRNIPEARLEAVADHYELFGGKSPYNAITRDVVEKLRNALKSADINLPVFIGMRNWGPLLNDTLANIHAQGLKNGIGIILAPHRSPASCQRYKENVNDALVENNCTEITYTYVAPWFVHPGFIQAQADEMKRTLDTVSQDHAANLKVLFCNHSIPIAMQEGCPTCDYSKEFEATGLALSETLGLDNIRFVYQSRSGNPQTPWLEPDICDALEEESAAGTQAVAVVPIGFFCDNVEVLYDLDIEAKEKAESLGLGFYRVKTVTAHPAFIQMFVNLVQDTLAGTKPDTETCQSEIFKTQS